MISPFITDGLVTMALTGTVKTIKQGKALDSNSFGFIQPDQPLPSQYQNKDVFFHSDRVHGNALQEGDQVCFEMDKKNLTKPAVWRVWRSDISPPPATPTGISGNSLKLKKNYNEVKMD